MTVRKALAAAGASPALIEKFAPAMEHACARFHINTNARLAGFVAQCWVESAGLTRLEENLYYTTPARLVAVWPSRFANVAVAEPYTRNPQRLANRVYAGRLGNGDEASGDGWRYRGRGLKQLTGKTNYAAASKALGLDYLAAPDLLLTPTHAALTAAWYWSANDCNALADVGRWDTVTRMVNGPGMLQASERLALTRAALARMA